MGVPILMRGHRCEAQMKRPSRFGSPR